MPSAAVEHLLSVGHRRIGFLGDLLSISTASERLRGYRQALERAGIEPDATLVRTDIRDPEAAAAAVDELLDLGDPPTAVFTGQNLLTIGGLRALRRAGLEREVALIGFDDVSLADMVDPAISVVAQDPQELGRAAAELLFRRLDGDTSPVGAPRRPRHPDRARIRRDPTAHRPRPVIVIGGEALVDLVDENGATRAVAGGGPFNTAVALGRLEVPVGFLGTLSRDDHGSMLEQLLVDAGVDTSLVRWSSAPTPHAVVHRQQDGRNSYTFELAGTAFADLPPDDASGLPEAAWAVHVGTLALAIDPPAAAFEALVDREAGQRRIVLDPNVRPAIFGDPARLPHAASSGWPDSPTSSSSATTMPAGSIPASR